MKTTHWLCALLVTMGLTSPLAYAAVKATFQITNATGTELELIGAAPGRPLTIKTNYIGSVSITRPDYPIEIEIYAKSTQEFLCAIAQESADSVRLVDGDCGVQAAGSGRATISVY